MHAAKPTEFQRSVAAQLGVSLRGVSQSVAAALIHDAVGAAIEPDATPREPTERQVKFATDLGVYRPGDSFRVCATRIDEELFRRNVSALKRLKLKPGDVVTKTQYLVYGDEGRVIVRQHEVSSIGANLRVYFRNPVIDSGAWPSQLSKDDTP